jgi:hypothetical protein
VGTVLGRPAITGTAPVIATQVLPYRGASRLGNRVLAGTLESPYRPGGVVGSQVAAQACASRFARVRDFLLESADDSLGRGLWASQS